MRKVIITGGPNTGKTDLLYAIRKKQPEYTFVAEPATIIIEAEHEKERSRQGYVGIFPWNNYAAFGPKVIAKSLELEGNVESDSDLVVLDRSLIDTVAYARLNDCNQLLPELYEHINAANYQKAFLCDFVGKYTRNRIRTESFAEAQIIQQELQVAYKESGIDVVQMPSVSIEERIQIFTRELSS